MRLQTGNCEFPYKSIASFIDGEPNVERQPELENHFSNCPSCSEELNRQKQFLCGLDSSLRSDPTFRLPADFTKLIIVNAESDVGGLRRPAERLNVAIVCVALVLLVFFAVGTESSGIPINFYLSLDKIVAVAGFLGHLTYSIFLGSSVILHSLSSHFNADTGAALLLSFLFAGSTLFVSRTAMDKRRS